MATHVEHATTPVHELPREAPPTMSDTFVLDLNSSLAPPPQQPDPQVIEQSHDPMMSMTGVQLVHQPPPTEAIPLPAPPQPQLPPPTPLLSAPLPSPSNMLGGSRYKRHWLTNDQVAKVDEAFMNWRGNWRGKEPQLKALAAELGISVEKLKKRVDYMRRRRENKAAMGDGSDGMSMDGFVDDGSGQPLAKRPRPMGAGIRPLVPPRPSRIPTEPFHPPKCIFTHSGCLSTPETGGQLMIVVTPTCGHRWVCLACFSDPFKVDDYLKLTGSCPTCRDTGITDVKQLITISDSELMKQPCRWCRHKMRNMAFLPCLHISEYCTDCFDQAGNGFFANEEKCTTCEQKFTKALHL